MSEILIFKMGDNKTDQRLRTHGYYLWAVRLAALFGGPLSSLDSTDKILDFFSRR